ncbi:Peptidase, M23/M37 family [Archangium gephyra]|nr:Peptidase, M23/M37 family [Archangium gephyra]
MKSLGALAALAALAPATALAVRNVGAPLAGTVAATTYSSSGAYHGAVDIDGGTCGTTPITTGVAGTLAWNVVINTASTLCYTAMTGAQNVARHTFADGFTFRLMNFNRTAQTFDRTCDRCNIGAAGDAGIPANSLHLQRDKSGTKDTSWYAGYATVGEALSLGELVGVLD